MHSPHGTGALPHAPSGDALSEAMTTRSASPYLPEELTSLAVIVRIRPMTNAESAAGHKSVWTSEPDRLWQSSPCAPGRTMVPQHVYPFDRVFCPDDATSRIFDERVRNQVSRTLLGYNSTVLAYGQTSSGKTTTIRGKQSVDGLIALSTQHVLEMIEQKQTSSLMFKLKMSYLEIYNESVQDLLSGATGLNIFEKKGGGVVVQDLMEKEVADWKSVEALLSLGDDRKHVGQTLHNDRSSRSHTVFRLTVECTAREDANSKEISNAFSSELNIVDLAGSERSSPHIRNGGSSERAARANEGAHINKSLLVLSTVIHKLSEAGTKGSSPVHVPYRSSKITRILQNSLGGNAYSMLVCCVTPASCHAEETHNTLRFATRARRVRTLPMRQEQLSLTALLKKYEAEVRELKLQLAIYQKAASSMPCPSVGTLSPSPSMTSLLPSDSVNELPDGTVDGPTHAELATQTSPISTSSVAEADDSIRSLELVDLQHTLEDCEHLAEDQVLLERELNELDEAFEDARSMAGSEATSCAPYSDAGESGRRSSRSLSGAVQQRLEKQQRRMLLLETENARLVQRLSSLIEQVKAGMRSTDSRKWRHKYMVEVLRRSSLERRNGQLRRQLLRMQGDCVRQVAVRNESCSSALQSESWDGASELDAPCSPRRAHLDRLAYLGLETSRGKFVSKR